MDYVKTTKSRPVICVILRNSKNMVICCQNLLPISQKPIDIEIVTASNMSIASLRYIANFCAWKYPNRKLSTKIKRTSIKRLLHNQMQLKRLLCQNKRLYAKANDYAGLGAKCSTVTDDNKRLLKYVSYLHATFPVIMNQLHPLI